MTKMNDYQPTPAEIRLLRVIENPNHYDKNVTEICKLAEISRNTYYSIMKKEEFSNFLRDTALAHIKGEMHQLWNAAAKHGKQGNFQYWKALMDATGQYTEKQRIEVEVSGKLEDYF